MLIEQLMDLEKVRLENMKFRTDIPDRVMDGWSVTHRENTIVGCLQNQIALKIFKSRTQVTQARPVIAGHYMAFKHHISFATDLAPNFGCDRFRITPDIVSKHLCAAI